ncbi:cytochrome P450 4C1-like [Pararge aegeria]|uniref:Jg25969 protein n=1 Tax=Pararge aegeria aegeria TaxID=348720 RepID=A0A8S4RD47_9NEOP|nr:cytochrome P450 4C1-like [Pararge aegeria]XP_039751487.1 cytochrome P450 4C1-like [Pararge aegeria]CAH2234756.1 jg25969 [Pararge aegeria aegeria]
MLSIMLSFGASVVMAYFVVLCIYHRFSRRGRLRAKIPGPTYWPIIGNTMDIILPQDKLFLYLRTLHKKYGDTVGLGALDISSVMICNPNDIEKILSSTKFIEKQQPYTFLRGWLGEGLLTSYGKKWHQRRKLLTPAFHFNILKRFFRTIEEETEVFLESLAAEVENENTDIVQLISNMTLRTVCKTAMGTSMNEGIQSLSTKYFNAIQKLGAILIQRSCKVWLFLDFTYRLTQTAREEKKVLQDLHGFTRDVIQQRKSYLKDNPSILNLDSDEDINKKGRLAMLDLLIQNQNEGGIDDEGIREEVDTFMFRGHDTTSMALVFFIMRLADEPEIQDKIYEELKSIFGNSDRPPTMEDLKEMRYLECCIKESLRLYPSVHFIGRYVREEVELGGYMVPADSIVSIHIYDVHHRPDIYPEPERFIPERFSPEKCLKRHPYAYIPFSAGPRNCIGQKFAMLETKTLMSSLLRKYRLEPVTRHSDVVFLTELVLRPKGPIYVKFCSR